MKTLSTPIFNKIVKDQSLSTEAMHILLSLALVCDASGRCDIHYEHFCRKILKKKNKSQYSQFYQCLHTLAKKGYIRYKKNSKSKRLILITLNNWRIAGTNAKNYMRLDAPFYTNFQFLAFKAGEIRTMMFLHREWSYNVYYHNDSIKETHKSSIAKTLGISSLTLSRYMRSLKKKGLVHYINREDAYIITQVRVPTQHHSATTNKSNSCEPTLQYNIDLLCGLSQVTISENDKKEFCQHIISRSFSDRKTNIDSKEYSDFNKFLSRILKTLKVTIDNLAHSITDSSQAKAIYNAMWNNTYMVVQA